MSQPTNQTTTPTDLPLQPPATLLIGDVGVGKTRSLVTFAEAGLDVFVVVTEPTGVDTLIDSFEEKGLIEKLHYHQVTPSRKGWDDMLKQGKVLSISNQEMLSKQQPTSRSEARWIDVLKVLSNFTCQRTGKSYGPIDSLSDTCAAGIDSLSGLNLMSMDITIGDKLTASPGEWGIAMQNLERLILKLTADCKCFTFLTAHIDKEVDPISGASKMMAGALGAKLAPKLPRFFSEVLLCWRDKQNFYWSNSTTGYALKSRSFKTFDEKFAPDFKPIVEAYARRKAAVATKAT